MLVLRVAVSQAERFAVTVVHFAESRIMFETKTKSRLMNLLGWMHNVDLDLDDYSAPVMWGCM